MAISNLMLTVDRSEPRCIGGPKVVGLDGPIGGYELMGNGWMEMMLNWRS